MTVEQGLAIVAPGSGQFELRSTDTLYSGPIFRLVDELYASPRGEEFRRQIVRHDGAVAVVPLHEDRSVTVIRQYRASVGERLLEIPAGLIDHAGEDLADAARRELREETGYVCGQLDYLCTYLPAPGITDERVTIFVARQLRSVGDERHGPEEDDLVVCQISLDDVLDAIRDGSMIDGKTAYALALLLAQGE